MITANLKPDHSTIAEFRVRHETALSGLFTDVLAVCARAGLVKVGVVAIDGTKMSANASQERNHGYERIAREILAEAARIDAEEDELYGDARGDELPSSCGPRRGARRRCARPSERSRPNAPSSGSSRTQLVRAGTRRSRRGPESHCRWTRPRS